MATKKTAAEKFERQRFNAFHDMRKATLAVAQRIEGLVGDSGRDDVLAWYEIGACIKDVSFGERIYGFEAVAQIARFTGIPFRRLIDARDVARWLTKEMVEDFVKELPPEIGFKHFIAVCRVKKSDLRFGLLAIAGRDGLSARQLENRIRTSDLWNQLPPPDARKSPQAAADYHRKRLEDCENRRGPTHLDTFFAARRLVELLESMGNTAEAMAIRQRHNVESHPELHMTAGTPGT